MKHLLVLVSIFASVRTTHAWGKEGHEIVANLAWSFLSNSTQDKISDLLGINPSITSSSSCESCSPLALIADWADAVRHTHYYQWTAPLHYIDVRDDLIPPSGCPAGEKDTLNDACHFDYNRDCPADFCVAGAIVNYTDILMGASKETHSASVEALKFLTHFVGDIHQPLHASRTTDRGGNSIHVSFHGNELLALNGRHRRQLRGGHSYAKTLHGVWDDDIIEKALHDDFNGSRVLFEEYLQAWMKTNVNYVQQWLACPIGRSQDCTTLWGEESFHYAIEWAYRNVDGSAIVDGDVLSEQYQQTRRPIVEQRLAAGGIRLAVTLEMALYGTTLQIDSIFGK